MKAFSMIAALALTLLAATSHADGGDTFCAARFHNQLLRGDTRTNVVTSSGQALNSSSGTVQSGSSERVNYRH